MNSNDLKSVIEKVRSELSWPVQEQSNESPAFHVVTYPNTKSHVILVPGEPSDTGCELDYLHGLGHATFCEKVHPLFSLSGQFAPQEKRRQYLEIVPALNVACDWFIDHWLTELAPEEMLAEFRENLPEAEEILAEVEQPRLEDLLDASLIIAQGIHYLKEPIVCEGTLKIAVDAFLSIPPEQPSAENCVLLVNRLMATYSDKRARFVRDGENFAWELFEPAEESVPGEAPPGNI